MVSIWLVAAASAMAAVAEDDFKQGVELYRAGKYRAAIAAYDKAIKAAPQAAEAYNNRGLAHFKLGEHDQAIKNYDMALKLKPSLTDARTNRGNARFAQKKFDLAIKDFDEVIRRNDKLPGLHRQRAVHHRHQLLQVERLGQVLEGAPFRRLDRRQQRGLGAHDDDAHFRAQLPDARHEIQPVLVRHDHVRDDQVAVAILDPFPQRGGGTGGPHVMAEPAQRLLPAELREPPAPHALWLWYRWRGTRDGLVLRFDRRNDRLELVAWSYTGE